MHYINLRLTYLLTYLLREESMMFTQKCANALMSIVFFIIESLLSKIFFPVTTPALFTRMSTQPTSDFT